MTYKFGLQKIEGFAMHSEICKNLKGVGYISAQFGIAPFDPLGNHCFVPQINEESPFVKFIGKQVIHVCVNCGLVYEDVRPK